MPKIHYEDVWRIYLISVMVYIGHEYSCLFICMNIGESIGDTTARFPYKRTQEYGISVIGLPEEKSLKHPSSYGRLTLRQILANKDNIIVQGMAIWA